MHREILHIGGFTIYSFGLMVIVGFAGGETGNVGSGYTGSEWQTGSMMILPVELAFDSEDDGIADRQAIVEDGTTHEFDRGSYKDPDQVAVVVVVPSELEAIDEPITAVLAD